MLPDMLHLALYHPAIPQNTGNIARLCVGMNAHLHLIGPHGFDLSDKAVRRAGLDYWPHLMLTEHADERAFLVWLEHEASSPRPWLITKHGPLRFDQPAYRDGDVLILGNENTGLPESWHERWPERRVSIPIRGPIRSFNLANAAAIVLAHASLRISEA
jgi:tRNA (cytidine/uridine-2'-O-)-methyltransferase